MGLERLAFKFWYIWISTPEINKCPQDGLYSLLNYRNHRIQNIILTRLDSNVSMRFEYKGIEWYMGGGISSERYFNLRMPKILQFHLARYLYKYDNCLTKIEITKEKIAKLKGRNLLLDYDEM